MNTPLMRAAARRCSLLGTWLLCTLLACTATPAANDTLPSLPTPISNNAVAAVTLNDGVHLVSFLGLKAGKTHQDVTTASFHLAPGAQQWAALPPPPGPGRLAATAATVGRTVYVFGGYTVAADGAEKSIETVHALDLITQRYTQVAAMPVPVDDTLSAVYAQRYIYLVSGWHDSGNVNLVQVYDTQEDVWFQATPFPGRAVFGQAGGIAGNTLVVCGGVYVHSTTGAREFKAEQACLRGDIRAADPTRIDWRSIAAHPGAGRYRAAATGHDGTVVFAGGSDNPYNFNGIGYNDVPSNASESVYVFDVFTNAWRTEVALSEPSMDHRGLLALGNGRFAIVGGMRRAQRVSSGVLIWSPAPE
ncbi:MAG: Kelch repeat-containing protein [Gammaproteobacteria bacterium]